jgi:hypothetical protein
MAAAPDALPSERRDEALRAVKLAEVRGEPPRIHPIGRFHGRAYDHLDEVQARCHRHDHRAPDIDCTCGFHAVERTELLGEVTTVLADSVVLEVELSGMVVEHERGYRAETQRVLGVRFPDRCAWCDTPATRVAPGRRWRSACGDCPASRRRATIGRAEATARLGIDVSFAHIADEPTRVRRLGIARALAMIVLAIGCVVAARRAGLSEVVVAEVFVAAIVCASLAAATLAVRSVRRHEALFVGQCASLVAAAAAIIVATA